jgi:hypothetical protein
MVEGGVSAQGGGGRGSEGGGGAEIAERSDAPVEARVRARVHALGSLHRLDAKLARATVVRFKRLEAFDRDSRGTARKLQQARLLLVRKLLDKLPEPFDRLRVLRVVAAVRSVLPPVFDVDRRQSAEEELELFRREYAVERERAIDDGAVSRVPMRAWPCKRARRPAQRRAALSHLARAIGTTS